MIDVSVSAPMTKTIYAIDSQFAVSTGSNVNSSAGRSRFDYPPNSTKDLVITSQDGDPDPFVFNPGDVYTLTFGGNGGTTIQNATILRSDYGVWDGDEGHAVVFEGLDSNGNPAQVVWTPEFDLEAWYWNNHSGGTPPEFYTTDQDGATLYQAVCFEASMLIETPVGARPAGELRAGDMIVTREHGVQPIKWVAQRAVRGWGRHAPVVFDAGTIGNRDTLVLSQQHRVLFDAPEAEARFGAREVLIPAVAFINGDTIRLRPRDMITYVHVLCAGHELVSCQDVVCESLYLGKVARGVIGAMEGGDATADSGAMETFMDVFASGPDQEPARPFLTVREGMTLMADIAGLPPSKPVMFLKPGLKNAWPYQLNPAKGLDADGLLGLPAFVKIVTRAA